MFLVEKCGCERGGKEKKTMQQLCRKVCNGKRNDYKASIYKGFGGWFHGHMGHETRGDEGSIVGF